MYWMERIQPWDLLWRKKNDINSDTDDQRLQEFNPRKFDRKNLT